jgi:hypothetical protein
MKKMKKIKNSRWLIPLVIVAVIVVSGCTNTTSPQPPIVIGTVYNSSFDAIAPDGTLVVFKSSTLNATGYASGATAPVVIGYELRFAEPVEKVLSSLACYENGTLLFDSPIGLFENSATPLCNTTMKEYGVHNTVAATNFGCMVGNCSLKNFPNNDEFGCNYVTRNTEILSMGAQSTAVFSAVFTFFGENTRTINCDVEISSGKPYASVTKNFTIKFDAER